MFWPPVSWSVGRERPARSQLEVAAGGRRACSLASKASRSRRFRSARSRACANTTCDLIGPRTTRLHREFKGLARPMNSVTHRPDLAHAQPGCVPETATGSFQWLNVRPLDQAHVAPFSPLETPSRAAPPACVRPHVAYQVGRVICAATG